MAIFCIVKVSVVNVGAFRVGIGRVDDSFACEYLYKFLLTGLFNKGMLLLHICIFVMLLYTYIFSFRFICFVGARVKKIDTLYNLVASKAYVMGRNWIFWINVFHKLSISAPFYWIDGYVYVYWFWAYFAGIIAILLLIS